MNPTRCQDGTAIRRLREGQGVGVTEFAARVGIKRQSLSNIELGNKPAGLGTLIKIARELGVPLDDIVTDEDAAEPEGAAEAA